MIGFRLDGRSNVVPYLQIVEQVRDALRTGLLETGDRLPTVRDVASSLAMNPNTVLKAYRQLEHDGLVEGRPGQGTFVVRSLAGPSLASQAALRRELLAWLGRARDAGLQPRGHPGVDGDHAARVRGRRSGVTVALETTGVAKRYGRTWALRDCTLAVPAGRVAGLVGPNGAGKTTLLRLAVGLKRPTRGEVRVFGQPPGDDPALLGRVGFVAQDTPLYGDLSAAEHLEFGRRLNPTWDGDAAAARLARLEIAIDRPVRSLSGGQRAQVALTLALAKRPDLLVLDEPVASLDPLARREFLSELMGEVADRNLTVILSSHLIADLELRCDYLVVLSASRVQVLGDVDDLLAGHAV